ncbi:MAG: hypothetical protein ACO37F_07420 [Pirellulales bacterium]|jgi:hypothetical protein
MTGDQHHSNQQPLATASIELPPELPVGSWIEPAALPGSGDLLLVPVVEADGATLMPPLLAWVEQAASVPPTVLELYGTIVIWTPGRVAVASAADRLPRATAAVNEFTATVGELVAIEEAIAGLWADYEADLSCGFVVAAADASRLPELAERYRQSMSLAGRLARLSPRIHRPPEHPPTLAGQLGERLRDRCRLADREEFADDQLETIIRLYEGCGQRASDRMLAQREHVLTWVIVLLLAAETVLLLVDLLAAAGG